MLKIIEQKSDKKPEEASTTATNATSGGSASVAATGAQTKVNYIAFNYSEFNCYLLIG